MKLRKKEEHNQAQLEREVERKHRSRINDTLTLKIEGLNLIQNKYKNYYSIKNNKINESI